MHGLVEGVDSHVSVKTIYHISFLDKKRNKERYL